MSRRVALALGIFLHVLAQAPHAEAQISFSNLAQVRRGKDPFDPLPTTSKSRITRFDQFNLDYWSDPLRLGFRYESYVPSDDALLETNLFTRRYAEWSTEGLDVLVGNYEAIFGRGLVLRAYQLPGVVREEFGTPQFGDSRDLEGVRLQLRGPRYEFLALQGKPRSPDLPPTARRGGTVAGATAVLDIVKGVRAGGEYLRLDTQGSGAGSRVEAPGVFVQLGLDPWLQRLGIRRLSMDSYLEHARVRGLALAPVISSTKSSPDQGYAYYFSQSLFLEEILPGVGWGLSYEYKDYQNFELGVNQPPSVVREHTSVLLTRSKHVPRLLQEEGYQFESRLNYRSRADLTLSWSRAEDHALASNASPRLHEFYAELAGHARDATLSIYADKAQDGAESIRDRQVYGTYTLVPLRGPHSLEMNYEQLTAERDLGRFGKIDFKDNYASFTYAWAGIFALSGVRQTTDDPNEAQARRAYDSLGGSVRAGNHHELLLFWGRRRGGLQCTSGTCYKVRAFDGVSLDLVSRF